MIKTTKGLLEFWEEQMKHSHRSSNYFFRKSPSHYHMMLIVMSAFKSDQKISVEELKTKLFKTSRPKSALIINEACEKGFFINAPEKVASKHPEIEVVKDYNDLEAKLLENSIYQYE